MGTKNVKVFIWLALIVAVLTSEVLAVKDLLKKTQLEKTEKKGLKDHKYGVSVVYV
ncbi:hypothetical protein MKX03_004487, partial [Papaver bracteatum]